MKAKKNPKFIVEVMDIERVGKAELKAEIEAALEERIGTSCFRVKHLNARAVQKLGEEWS